MNLCWRTISACSKMGLFDSRSNRLMDLSCCMVVTLAGCARRVPYSLKVASTPNDGERG